MAHLAAEGLEVAAAVAELADRTMIAIDRRKHLQHEHDQEIQDAIAKEKAENERLRMALDMYKDALESFKEKGLLEHLEKLDGMGQDQLCDKLKERVDSPQFLDKLATGNCTLAKDGENSWVVVDGKDDLLDDYVVVSQDDIVDAIASYMAKCLIEQPKTKSMTPEELQKALSNAFTNQEKMGIFRRIWRTGRVMYTVASWTVAAVGIYRNPLLIRAAFMTLWTTIAVLTRLIK